MNDDCPNGKSGGDPAPFNANCPTCPYQPPSLESGEGRTAAGNGRPTCVLFENTGAATLVIERDMTISMVNANIVELFGYSRQEIFARKSFLEFLTPEYRELSRLYHEMTLSGQIDPPKTLELKIVDKAGRIRETVAEIGWIGDMRQAIVSVIDLTERKTAERERHNLSEIVEQSMVSILLTDVQGTITYVNAAFEALSGYDRDEIVGQTVEHAFFSDQDRLVFRKMRFSVSCRDASENRTQNQHKDGRSIATETHIAAICDHKGRVAHLVCTKKDITRETELERQLLESQKMEAIGTLASGIAHDFNNILSGIMGFAEMAAKLPGDQERVRRHMGRIIQACERARDLAKQVLAFGHQKESESKPVAIQPLIRETLKLLRASVPASIEFQVSLQAATSVVMADPTRIHQVILNLCTNAAQSMESSGGRLQVVLENLNEPPPIALPQEACASTAYVRLSVRDNGEGIDAQSLTHVFEPYYTTKASRGGTGLGLSVVQKIVQTIGGFVTVESQTGSGSTFAVYLPRIDTPLPAGPSAEHILPRGRERILVVDDEPVLLEVMRDMLWALGYHVETAAGARFALARLRKDPQCYDLVITDLTMPRMNGRRLAAEIGGLCAHLPVILCTGMSRPFEPSEIDPPNIKTHLSKPIQFDKLAVAVRQALDNSRPVEKP